MIQEHRRVDESVHPSGSVLLSPERDLAIMLPVWLVKAIEAGGKNTAAEDIPRLLHLYREALQDFLSKCVNTEDFKSTKVAEVSEVTCLFQGYDAEETFVSKWLFRVLLGSYYSGIRNATKVTDTPVMVADLERPIDIPSPEVGPVRRFLRRLVG